MPVLSIRMSEDEHEALKKYARAKNVSMSKAMKDTFFDKLEDEFDIECFDKAYDDFLKNPVTYSPDEVKRIIH